jgi:hypothetical protein
MAYRVTIKVSKSDDAPWFWQNTENYAVQEAMVKAFDLLGIESSNFNDGLVFDGNKQFSRMMTFDTKLEANQWLIRLLGWSANNPQYIDVLTEAHTSIHTDWKEEINVEEI